MSNCVADMRHGHRSRGRMSKTYAAWNSMRNRCLNPQDTRYKWYGARGITVCPEWGDFRAFIRDMGESPVGMTLERKDNAGSYSKNNCKWASHGEQARNRRNTCPLTFRGRTQCLTDWADEVNIARDTLAHRIARGWSPAKAITTPTKKRRNWKELLSCV